MEPFIQERRKSPRVPVNDRTLCVVRHVRARVLDVSRGGMLLDCGGSVIERTGRLVLPLGFGRFTADIEVRYERPTTDVRNGVLLGVALVDVPADSRSALDRFLARAAQ